MQIRIYFQQELNGCYLLTVTPCALHNGFDGLHLLSVIEPRFHEQLSGFTTLLAVLEIIFFLQALGKVFGRFHGLTDDVQKKILPEPYLPNEKAKQKQVLLLMVFNLINPGNARSVSMVLMVASDNWSALVSSCRLSNRAFKTLNCSRLFLIALG